jgi:tetratricopeptide (TPR) repeat protein
MSTLTPEAIWILDTWQLRSFPLIGLSIEGQSNGKELGPFTDPKSPDEKLTLIFADPSEQERWRKEIQKQPVVVSPDDSFANQYRPEGVALVRQAPNVPHVVLEQVSFASPNTWAADRGAQLRAGMRGADAIINVTRHKCPDMGWGARHVSGLAIRVQDEDARKQLRLRWYGEEVSALVKRMLILLAVQAGLLFVAAVFCTGAATLSVPTGETMPELLKSAGLGVGMVSVGPLILIGLLWVLRWFQLLRATGLAVLAATTGRLLTVWSSHLLAVRAAGNALAETKLWMLLDPVDWAFVIGGIVLCVRAWRLATDSRQILPQENQVMSRARLAWSRVLFGGACIYAVALLGFVGTSRYQASTYLLQPGADPKREQEALLALNQGIALADKEDLNAAEQSWQRSLRIWEELTKHRSAPSVYRINLALTLCNLGWVNHRSNRLDKAEEYYARAVAVGDELREAPELDVEMKQTLNNAREMLAALRSGKSAPLLEQKDQAARAKFEEAQVKEQKGEVEAENLFAEAVALWEEILPQATNEEYQKYAFSQLASGLLHLGDLQDRLGKRSAAETSLKKAIEYGEKAVTLDPNRPLLKHKLEVAKNLLDGLHDRAMQEEITRLCKTDRFADAFDLCVRSVEEDEEQLRSGKDHDAAALRLAYRLDRFAWFLAHCPDQRVRDTKAAVKKARRATELQPSIADYWYTLAMVQYRNGDWQDSLASVEKVKAKEGSLDANGWFLSAMNLHQLKQRNDARAAFRKADEWIEERKRQGEENALLRFQYEMVRPAIEALRREAQNLIEGKDLGGEGVG